MRGEWHSGGAGFFRQKACAVWDTETEIVQNQEPTSDEQPSGHRIMVIMFAILENIYVDTVFINALIVGTHDNYK